MFTSFNTPLAAAAALQGTVGVGFAKVSVPILTLVNSGFTPIPQVILASPLTTYMVLRERQHIDLEGVAWVLSGRLPGAIAGMDLFGLLAQRTLDGMIAGIVVLAAVAMAAGWSVPQTRRDQFIAGAASGISGTTAAIGGSPLAFLYQHSSGERLRSSLAAIFSVGITINVTTLAVAGQINCDDDADSVHLGDAPSPGRSVPSQNESSQVRRAFPRTPPSQFKPTP